MRISDWSSNVCSSDLSATTLVPFPGVEVPLGGATVSGTFKATTWNLNALYEINRDINVYASVRRGYKSGGFNSTALNPADRFFAPETVTDYEIGLKSQWHLGGWQIRRSEAHTSELQSLMRTSYAVFCLKKKTTKLTGNQY